MKKILTLGVFVAMYFTSMLSCQKQRSNTVDNNQVAVDSQGQKTKKITTTMSPGQVHNYYLNKYIERYGEDPIHSPMTYEDDYLLFSKGATLIHL